MPQSLTEGQQTRLSDAERRLRDAVDSRRQMRALNSPPGWRRVGFDELPSPIEELAAVRSLELDVRAYLVERINVLAEAGWLIRPIENYSEYVRTEADGALEHGLSVVDPTDRGSLNRTMLEKAAEGCASYWIERARVEFAPPGPPPSGVAAVMHVRRPAPAGHVIAPMQEYPRYRYSWNRRSTIVNNIDEDKALGGGWTDNPDAFARYEGGLPKRPNNPDPLRWINLWHRDGLSDEVRRKLRAAVLRADATFWEAPNTPGTAIQTMRILLGDLAKSLFNAKILTEQILAEELPVLVWDTAIAAAWWHRASETRTDIFPEPMGHYWVWLGEDEDWSNLFRAPIQHWRAELQDVPSGSPANAGPSEAGQRTWRDLQTEFETHAEEHDNLAADIDTLRPGKWALIHAASPRVERIFKEIAASAAAKADLSPPDEKTEPWQLWLEFMWSQGWRRPEKLSVQARPVRQVRSWQVFKRIAEEGARTLPRVFQTSAHCCRDLEERNGKSSTVTLL